MSQESDSGALPRRLSARSPKGEQLRGILERQIGAQAPGTPLPSERELAERYRVARMTVRTELDRLVAEGLVYRVQGRGTFVAEPRVTQAMTLSSFSEDMRERGHEPGSRVLAQGTVDADATIAARLELAHGAPLVRIHRVRTADGEPLAVEEAFLPAARFAGLEDAELAHGSLFELLETRWGVRMARAEQRVVAVALGAEDAELLGVAGGHPALRFDTLARDPDGRAVFAAWSLYRGDRYEVRLAQERDG